MRTTAKVPEATPNGLPAPRAFHERKRRLKQLNILRVIGCIGAVDLYPLSRTGQAARLKLGDVGSGKLQFRRGGSGEAQPHTAVADAGEHLVANKISIQAVYFPGANARQLE